MQASLRAWLPQRENIMPDLLAGLTGAVAGAPQAMGFALVAGISPLYGLYTAFTATLIGGIFSPSSYVTMGPSNALALVVGSALAPFQGSGTEIERLFTLTLLVGIFQLVAGLLRMGGLTRFVSNAVMTGFISGAGLLIILGQLSHLTGIETEGSIPLLRFFDWLVHLPQAHPGTTLIGILSIFIIHRLHHTRFRSVATLTAIIVTSLIVMLLGWNDVELVRDQSAIGGDLPGLVVPNLSYAPELWSAALAGAVVGLIQAAALSQTIPESDGRIPSIRRDFVAHGIVNIAGGFFQNMPSSGSLSRTAVNVAAGARSRWANIFAGLLVAAFLLLLGDLIEVITLAALAGHLVVAAVNLVKLDAIRLVWRVSFTARVAMVATFASTLVLPLENSIYIGVLLSLGMYVYTSSQNVSVVRLEPLGDGHFKEAPVPQQLPSGKPVILSVNGHLYFAAVDKLERQLPNPRGTLRPIVILRLRDNQYLGSTGIRFLTRYSRSLQQRDGRLFLAGIGSHVREQLESTGAVGVLGPDSIFYADEVIFRATERALEYAQQWIREQEEAKQIR